MGAITKKGFVYLTLLIGMCYSLPYVCVCAKWVKHSWMTGKKVHKSIEENDIFRDEEIFRIPFELYVMHTLANTQNKRESRNEMDLL